MLTADFLDVSKFRVYSGTRESWPFESSTSRAQVLTFRVEYESSITRFLKLMLEHFSSRVQWNLDIVDILGGTLLYTISSFSTIQVQSIKQSMKSVTEKSTLYRVFPLLAYPLYRGSTVIKIRLCVCCLSGTSNFGPLCTITMKTCIHHLGHNINRLA